MTKEKKPQQVYTLLVQLGRKPDDGLPADSTGAALMCYASGVDEAEAVRETVAVLKQADLAPLDVTGYGTREEREEQGHEIDADEAGLMQKARDENAVIVAHMTPFYGELPDMGEDEDEAEEVAAPVASPTPKSKPKPRPAPKGKGTAKGKAPNKGSGKGPAKGPRQTKPRGRS